MTNILFCTDCPRKCKLENSYCGKEQNKIRIAKVMRHKFEEPLICSEEKGCGAVFFSNCSLKCVFCQNYELSHLGEGKDFSVDDLVDIFKKVQNSNVETLDLVTPTHYTDLIIKALKKAKLTIPVVWNSSGYEKEENIEKLKGLVDIFLFDFKYYDNALSLKYSKVPNYFEQTMKALKKARQVVGEDKIENGLMKKGIIVRHLILPTHTDDSIKIFEEIKKVIGNQTYISLMSQYIPFYKAVDFPEINRKLKPLEYKKVVNKVVQLGFTNGFLQDFESASKEYTPDFTLDKFWKF